MPTFPTHENQALPIHFFTIVLNGEPFIRHHINVFRHLPFPWHWHIVEGVAELRHDTAWSLANGGRIDDRHHQGGLSNDGTSTYLDQLAALFPENITLYRPPTGQFWDGKLAMVSAPLQNIRQECLLWQVDADEFWTLEQLCNARQLFLDHPHKMAAFYWCHFFVGRGLLVSSRNCYSQNPAFEWLRTWRYTPGCHWRSHEPPQLCWPGQAEGVEPNLTGRPVFSHDETAAQGLVFQHFAYVLPGQLRFKESYYGYRQALFHWLQLQKQQAFPVRLGEFFSWVADGTTVDTATHLEVVPLPLPRPPLIGTEQDRPPLRVVLDGVFFQYRTTGIARVWQEILQAWAAMPFRECLVVLDRDRTAPRLPGLRYRDLPRHDYARLEQDRQLLQQICDQEGADLFLSTYYTAPLSTRTILMIHDMIPEAMGVDLSTPNWQEKRHAIGKASCFCAVSLHSARDLVRFYPHTADQDIHVIHHGVSDRFRPAGAEEISAFRERFGITRPYYLFVGPVEWYKNFERLLEAYYQLPNRKQFQLVRTRCGENESHPLFSEAGAVITTGWLEEADLRTAYSGALGLVYPSLYEGFGLPVLEAMACGCPVISGRTTSLPEVTGSAACRVDAGSVEHLRCALLALQVPAERQRLQRLGLERAERFRWQRTAAELIRVMAGEAGLRQGLDDVLLSQPLTGC